MTSSKKKEIENFKECLRIYGPKTLHNLSSAFLIWLFGNLVFIPLSSSLNWQTKTLCSLIFFVAFSLLVVKALPGLRKLIEAFSVFPARKYSLKRGLSYENSLLLVRYVFYIISTVIFYLLYFPFLVNFHPSISGIVLIIVLIWILFLALRILLVMTHRIIEWLYA